MAGNPLQRMPIYCGSFNNECTTINITRTVFTDMSGNIHLVGGCLKACTRFVNLKVENRH